MEFTEQELNRYSRQIVMNQIGQKGQLALKKAKVAVAGVGGLGSFSSQIMAGMGIGRIKLIDRDVVEITNLHRTPLYSSDSIDRPKVEIAALRLQELNPHIKIEAEPVNIDEKSAQELLEDIDIVIDGLDSFQARRVLNKVCAEKKIPFVFAGALGISANLSTFLHSEGSSCMECVFSGVEDSSLPTCDIVGVHPSILAIAAGIQVSEVVRIATGRRPNLDNKLLFVDLSTLTFDYVSISKRRACTVCGLGKQLEKPVPSKRIVELCGDGSFMISPSTPMKIDIAKATEKLKEKYQVTSTSGLGVTFLVNEFRVSLLSGGNALIRGSPHKKDSEKVYESIIQMING